MQPGVMEMRKPFVTFITKAMEDRAATIERGVYTTKDVDFALVTPAGSKDIIHRQVDEWLDGQRQQAQQERVPASWVRDYENMYKEWKAGKEVPLDGTSVLNWPAISPSICETLIKMNIRTIEDAAVMNEEAIARLGMGGRGIKTLAQTWVQASGGDAGKVSAKVAAQEQQISDLQTSLKKSQENVELLSAQVKQLMAGIAPPSSPPNPFGLPTTPASRVSIEDLMDDKTA